MASMNKPASDSSDWYQQVTDNWYSIERNLVDNSLVTAKGDLIAATAPGLLSRVPGGVDAQILVADSSQPMGLRWSASGFASSSARATTATSTTSTTFVDLDSMSLNVTVGSNNKVLVLFNASFQGTNSYATLRLLRGSTEIQATVPNANTSFWAVTAPLMVLDQPGAGTFTYKVQWQVSSGTVSQNTSDRTLIIIVLPG